MTPSLRPGLVVKSSASRKDHDLHNSNRIWLTEALAPANKVSLDQALQNKQHSSIWPYTGFTIPSDKSGGPGVLHSGRTASDMRPPPSSSPLPPNWGSINTCVIYLFALRFSDATSHHSPPDLELCSGSWSSSTPRARIAGMHHRYYLR